MAPLAYLIGHGTRADQIAQLLWALIVISIIVTVVISALLIGGIVRNCHAGRHVSEGPNGLHWITVGVGLSSIGLLIALFWTMRVLASTNSPKEPAAVTIDVTSEQWWWKVTYDSDDPSRTFTTANEIHIPAGKPVRIRLRSADVIHSFWVPSLMGKTDTIPGMTNETWIEADKPGRYLGQCTEFCGQQHAHMQFVVVAEPTEAFLQWHEHQTAPASSDLGGGAGPGEATFVYRCSACHTVRGTDASGTVAPDLSHLMTRQTLAAGALTNNVANLSAWILDPQQIKPGNRMPVLNLTAAEANDILSFLLTLK